MAYLPPAINAADKDAFEDFMSRVDDVNDILHGKNTEECYVTSENKSVINTSSTAVANTPDIASGSNDMDPAFKMMAADAEKRSIDRKRRVKIASKLKAEGNTAFAKGDYDGAIKLYTDGITQMKDNAHLWTNRALAYLKLGLPVNARRDCEWALKCDEKCVKAFVRTALAFQFERQWDEAEAWFSAAIAAVPEKETDVMGYIESMRKERAAADITDKVAELRLASDSDVDSIDSLLSTLSTPKSSVSIYWETLCNLQAKLQNANEDDVNYMAFQASNGLPVLLCSDASAAATDAILSLRLFYKAKDIPQPQFYFMENEKVKPSSYCELFLTTLQAICSRNDVKTEASIWAETLASDGGALLNLFSHALLLPALCEDGIAIISTVLAILSSFAPHKSACKVFFSTSSDNNLKEMKTLNSPQLFTGLMAVIGDPNIAKTQQHSFQLRVAVARCLNIAITGGLLTPGSSMVSCFPQLQLHILFTVSTALGDPTIPLSVVTSLLDPLVVISKNQSIHATIYSKKFAKNINSILKQVVIRSISGSGTCGALETLLGVLMNLSLSEAFRDVFSCDHTLKLLFVLTKLENEMTTVCTRAMGLISRLVQNDKMVHLITKEQGISTILNIIKRAHANSESSLLDYAVRTIAHITARGNSSSWSKVADSNGLEILVKLLNPDYGMSAANAGLILGNIFQSEVVCKHPDITRLKIVDRLLDLARKDSLSLKGEEGKILAKQQHNAVIACARIAQLNYTCRSRIRELDSLEVLHARFLKQE